MVKEIMFGGPECTQHSSSLAEGVLGYRPGSHVLTVAGAQERKSHFQDARREGGACLATWPEAPLFSSSALHFCHSETKHLPCESLEVRTYANKDIW